MEPFIGQIQLFGFNFAPRGWLFCNGQLLPIAQNTALFSLLGTVYGGDGETTFALPEMRGRVPVHPGNGPGLTTRSQGQKSGQENVTLSELQMPSHTHTPTTTVNAYAYPTEGDETVPTGKTWAKSGQGDPDYGPLEEATRVQMADGAVTVDTTIANTGGGTSHTNMQPWIGIYYCIALQGIYPSRN